MPRLNTAFFLLFTALVLSACDEQHPPEDPFEPESYFFQHVARGFNAALADTTELAIRSQQEWDELRPLLRLREEVRPIDFEQAMLLLVALPVEYSGYVIDINAVERDREGLVAHYYLREPGPDCLAAAVDSTPFQVAMVRRSDEPVRFVRELLVYRCELR